MKQRSSRMRAARRHLKWLTTRDIVTVVLFAAALFLQVLARRTKGFAQAYSVTVYRVLVESAGRLTSLFPFSVAEIGLYALVLAALVSLIRLFVRVVKKKTRLRRAFADIIRTVLSAAAILFFVYTLGCGINYQRTAFSEEAGFVVTASSREELAGLCESLAEEINAAAPYLQSDENGCLLLAGDVGETAREAMRRLAEEYETLAGFYPRPKGILLSEILSVQQLEGIYSPFTIEANYNRDMPAVDIPSCICHELSHLRGYMREDEANFISYLACRNSGDPAFAYSGAVLAFIHSMNALYADGGREEYDAVYATLCEQARRDLAANNAFWKQYDGKVAEVSNQVNDAYLKANKQAEGVKSYGRMVDLLLALYRSESGAEAPGEE